MKIDSEDEFDALMSVIDADLRARDIPIARRFIAALVEVAKRLGVEVIGGPIRIDPIPGNYSGESLSAHIRSWFQRQYGGRENVDPRIGTTICFLDGDFWIVNFPLFFGAIQLVCDASLTTHYPTLGGRTIHGDMPAPILNLFTQIEGITEERLRKLSVKESRAFMRFYEAALSTFVRLRDAAQKHGIANAIRYDLSVSAAACCGIRPDYGQSRWNSLQAAEKAMKLIIMSNGTSPPRVHILSDLEKITSAFGVSISDDILQAIQCSAGVRYGQIQSGMTEAAKAHMKAFEIVSTVIAKLAPSR